MQLSRQQLFSFWVCLGLIGLILIDLWPSQGNAIAFWQSEVNNCESVPEGITHIVFGFSLVNNDGEVELNFQNTDKYIKKCINIFKQKKRIEINFSILIFF